MYNNILSENNNIVKKNIANVFPLGVKDKALQGCNLSVTSSPPGESTLAISVSGDKQLPVSEDNSWGAICEKPYHVNLEGDRLESETLNLLSEDSVLQFINRQFSAFDFCESKSKCKEKLPKVLKRDKLANTYLEFLNSHKSFSTCDIEYYVGIFVSFIKAGADIEHACRFLSCGTQISTLECESCGYQHSVPYNCKLRICERCGAIRASELVKKHQPYLETLDPRQVRCITLTMKNVVCLKSGVSKIRRCYGRLLHRKYYKDGLFVNGKRQGRIVGSLYHIEATIGRDDFWHVHLHAIIVGDYIPQDTLSKDWADVTKEKESKADKDKKVAEFVDWVSGVTEDSSDCSGVVFHDSLSEFSKTDDSMIGGFVSVDTDKGNRVVWIEQKEKNATLKYCMKHLTKKMKTDSRWTPEKLVEYEMALSNVRLIQATGCFLGTLKDYKKEPFLCPECGYSLWRILDMSGNVIYSPLDRMINDWDREKLPSTPRMNMFVSDG